MQIITCIRITAQTVKPVTTPCFSVIRLGSASFHNCSGSLIVSSVYNPLTSNSIFHFLPHDHTPTWLLSSVEAKNEVHQLIKSYIADTPTGIFGVPLQVSIRYAHVAISLTNEQGESFVYGYVPIVVAKCGVFLKEKGMYSDMAKASTFR